MVLFLLVAACPVLPLIGADELRDLSLAKSLVGQRAFTAAQASSVVNRMSLGTERGDLAQAIFPAIVDKDNWSYAVSAGPMSARLASSGMFTPRAERVIITAEGAYLEVRPAAGLTPVLCLALERVSERSFDALLQRLQSESLMKARLQIVKRSIGNWMFTSAQIVSLLQAMEYREETSEAGFVLRPRSIEPQTWNTSVCPQVHAFDDCRQAD